MIKETEIEKCAQAYCNATFGTLNTNPLIKEAFKAGALWALQEYLKRLREDILGIQVNNENDNVL